MTRGKLFRRNKNSVLLALMLSMTLAETQASAMMSQPTSQNDRNRVNQKKQAKAGLRMVKVRRFHFTPNDRVFVSYEDRETAETDGAP
jgi:hypothetical protein